MSEGSRGSNVVTVWFLGMITLLLIALIIAPERVLDGIGRTLGRVVFGLEGLLEVGGGIIVYPIAIIIAVYVLIKILTVR